MGVLLNQPLYSFFFTLMLLCWLFCLSQSLIGDVDNAMRTFLNYYTVWKQFGGLPEFYNIPQGYTVDKREGYPLRPGKQKWNKKEHEVLVCSGGEIRPDVSSNFHLKAPAQFCSDLVPAWVSPVVAIGQSQMLCFLPFTKAAVLKKADGTVIPVNELSSLCQIWQVCVRFSNVG